MLYRAVLDTNVLVSALRSKRGASFRLLELLGDPRCELCISVPLLLEYEDVLKRDFMRATLTQADTDALLDYICSVATPIETKFRLRPALSDPDDDRILEVAFQASAAIVTFNARDFLGAAAFGVPVFTPQEFLRQLERES